MISLKQFKAKAYDAFGKCEYEAKNDPLVFLDSLSWSVAIGQAFSQKVLIEMNIRLDERSCFGRAIKSAVLMEKYFPPIPINFAEVKNNFFRELLVKNADFENLHDADYLAEILQYEEPHGIIAFKDGRQFDSIFTTIGGNSKQLCHPEIQVYDLWSGLYANLLISYAVQENYYGNYQKSLSILDLAEDVCPGLIVTQINKASVLLKLAKTEEAIDAVKLVISRRKDALSLFLLCNFTDDNTYKQKMESEYGPAMFNHLNSML